jgi:hypothetical protein
MAGFIASACNEILVHPCCKCTTRLSGRVCVLYTVSEIGGQSPQSLHAFVFRLRCIPRFCLARPRHFINGGSICTKSKPHQRCGFAKPGTNNIPLALCWDVRLWIYQHPRLYSARARRFREPNNRPFAPSRPRTGFAVSTKQ